MENFIEYCITLGVQNGINNPINRNENNLVPGFSNTQKTRPLVV